MSMSMLCIILDAVLLGGDTALQYSTVQYSTILQWSTVQCSTVKYYSAVQWMDDVED